jgi:hypothetical protein
MLEKATKYLICATSHSIAKICSSRMPVICIVEWLCGQLWPSDCLPWLWKVHPEIARLHEGLGGTFQSVPMDNDQNIIANMLLGAYIRTRCEY